MRNYIEWIIKHRKAVIAVTAIFTLALSLQLKSLAVTIDPAKLLPQSHPLVATGNMVEDIFGNKYTIVVGVHAKNGDALNTHTLEKVQRITSAIMKSKGVIKSNVVSAAARKSKRIDGNEGGLEVRQLMDSVLQTEKGMEELKAALDANRIYSNLIISTDHATLSIIAEYQNLGSFSRITDQVNAIIDREKDDSVEITLGGMPVFTSLIEKFSQRMAFFFPLSLLIISLVLYNAFRSVQALLLPLTTAMLAVIWSLGIMGFSGVNLDPFNATTPILILALSAGHAVQIMKRYYEEYHNIRRDASNIPPEEANRLAVAESVSKVVPVMLAAGTIAATSFFSLMVFDIKTIQTFGLFTGSGILSAMLLELTFIPALRSMLKAPGEREKAREQKQTALDAFVKYSAGAVLEKRGMVYAVGCAVIALLALGASQVRIDNSTKGSFYGTLKELKDDDAYNQRMAGSNPVYILVAGKSDDAIKSPDVLKGMEALQREIEKDPMVGKTVSIADYIKRINKAMNSEDFAFDSIPNDRNLIAQYLLMYSTSGEPGDFDSVVDYGYRNANIMVFLKTDSSSYMEGFVEKVKRLSDGRFGGGIEIKVGGGVSTGAALNEVLVHEKILNIIQIAAVVLVISSVIFRSLLAAALILAPLAVTVISNFGVMGFLGIPLQVATSTISAMAVGIGADYAIYLAYRMREELAREEDENVAIHKAFATAGKAVMLVALSVAAGYFVLVFSYGFLIHFWLGLLISLAMTAGSIASITLFPALIMSIRPRFIFQEKRGVVIRPPAISAAAAITVAAALYSAPSYAGEITATEIMKGNFLVSKVADSESDSTFRLINPTGKERVRQTHGFTKLIRGTTDNMRMVRFLSPSDVKGTVTLMIEHSEKDDDLWIYLPAMKKVRRLVAGNKKDNFVGTDFSYADVIGHKVEDWNHKLLRTETVDGADCYVIESLPATPKTVTESGYSRRVGWIRKDNLVTVKGEMYAENGELLKQFVASDIRLVDPAGKKYQAMRLESHNVQTSHKTVITFENFRADVGVKDELFTTRYMEKE